MDKVKLEAYTFQISLSFLYDLQLAVISTDCSLRTADHEELVRHGIMQYNPNGGGCKEIKTSMNIASGEH